MESLTLPLTLYQSVHEAYTQANEIKSDTPYPTPNELSLLLKCVLKKIYFEFEGQLPSKSLEQTWLQFQVQKFEMLKCIKHINILLCNFVMQVQFFSMKYIGMNALLYLMTP